MVLKPQTAIPNLMKPTGMILNQLGKKGDTIEIITGYLKTQGMTVLEMLSSKTKLKLVLPLLKCT